MSTPYVRDEIDEKTGEKVRVRCSYQKVVTFRDGKWQVQVTELKRVWDRVENRYIDVTPNRQFFEPLPPELKKEVTISIVEQRSALDPESLTNISGYFLRRITVTVPEGYENDFLSVVEGRVYVNDLASGICREITVAEMFRGTPCKVKMTKGTRISKAEFTRMLKAKEIYPKTLMEREGEMAVYLPV